MIQQSLVPKPRERGDQSIIPMINIVFLLLIFFMIAGQITSLRWPDIELPQFSRGAQASAPALIISIDLSGQFKLGDEIVALADIPQAVAAWPVEQTLTVVADRDLSAGQLNELLVLLKKLGIARIALLTAPVAAV